MQSISSLSGKGEGEIDELQRKGELLFSTSWKYAKEQRDQKYTIDVWNLKTNQHKTLFEGRGIINSLQIVGNFLFSSHWQIIKIWDLATLKLLTEVRLSTTQAINDFCGVIKDRLFLKRTSTGGTCIRLWYNINVWDFNASPFDALLEIATKIGIDNVYEQGEAMDHFNIFSQEIKNEIFKTSKTPDWNTSKKPIYCYLLQEIVKLLKENKTPEATACFQKISGTEYETGVLEELKHISPKLDWATATNEQRMQAILAYLKSAEDIPEEFRA